VTAVIQYQGITVLTGGVGDDDQYIDYCAFLPGKAAAKYFREYEKGMPLGTIDVIVLSEVLSDLELLREKGALNQ